MSAICGMYGRCTRDEAAAQDLTAMLAALEVRGPDGLSTRIDPQQQVVLGQRNLKLTRSASEPPVLSNEDGSLWLVCDGQVFNHRDLNSWVRGKGHVPRSDHSCELLLHLYEEEGIEGWRRVDGQFALALYDSRQQRMILGRDFLGVRPLYYWSSSAGLVFASEIKALLQHSRVPCGVDEVGVSHYLTFLTAPGPRTLFAGVQKLPPGTAAICGLDGSVELREYWDLLDEPIPERDDEAFYVDRVRELHHAAVERRKVDGPVGALLSGGNDSSANAALLARNGCDPLHTFTVGLAELEGQAKYNDLEYARRVASLIHSQHHEELISTDEFLRTIPVTVDAMDDMVSEPSSIFLYHALRLAKQQNLKVVITGEANDELCCGHGDMIRIRQGYYKNWQPFMQKPAWLRRAAAALVPLVAPRHRASLQRAAAGDEYFWNFETAWMESDKPSILTADAWQRCRSYDPGAVVARYAKRFRATDHGRRDYLNYIIYVMMQDYYFGNLMLGKLDLLAAHVGIEARCPYTEPAYAHFVFNIPAGLKARDGLVKYFFKKSIEGLLPNEIIYRPKQGFRTPVVELFRGALGDWAQPILMEGGLTRTGFLSGKHLDDMLRRHRNREHDYSNRLWTAMVLNLWHDRWIKPKSRPAELSHSLASRVERQAVLSGNTK